MFVYKYKTKIKSTSRKKQFFTCIPPSHLVLPSLVMKLVHIALPCFKSAIPLYTLSLPKGLWQNLRPTWCPILNLTAYCTTDVSKNDLVSCLYVCKPVQTSCFFALVPHRIRISKIARTINLIYFNPISGLFLLLYCCGRKKGASSASNLRRGYFLFSWVFTDGTTCAPKDPYLKTMSTPPSS
jgi:hypothetical protein